MNWANYSTLKTAGAVSFTNEKVTTREAVDAVDEVRDDDDNITTHAVSAQAKEEGEFIALTEKRWNGSTGEAQSDGKREYSLSDLEREKARFDSDVAKAQAQSDELAKAITDFKKL